MKVCACECKFRESGVLPGEDFGRNLERPRAGKREYRGPSSKLCSRSINRIYIWKINAGVKFFNKTRSKRIRNVLAYKVKSQIDCFV